MSGVQNSSKNPGLPPQRTCALATVAASSDSGRTERACASRARVASCENGTNCSSVIASVGEMRHVALTFGAMHRLRNRESSSEAPPLDQVFMSRDETMTATDGAAASTPESTCHAYGVRFSAASMSSSCGRRLIRCDAIFTAISHSASR